MPELFVPPTEVTNAFFPEGVTQHERLSGGIVNTTYKVTAANDQLTILQRLHKDFHPDMIEDYFVVAEHLRANPYNLPYTWELPHIVYTAAGETHTTDAEGYKWRAFEFIESDGKVPEVTIESAAALNGLLGKLHVSLSSLPYIPRFSIPFFHDTEYYAAKLARVAAEIPDTTSYRQAQKSLQYARKISLPDDTEQAIHGDPKPANALYQDEIPKTIIDWDTFMRGNPYIDRGDLLRSVTGKLLLKDSSFDVAQLDPVIGSYYETAQPECSEAEFIRNCRLAGKVLAMELGMRYLTDIVEDHYFDWDAEVYESRAHHNQVRARQQWKVFEAFD